MARPGSAAWLAERNLPAALTLEETRAVAAREKALGLPRGTLFTGHAGNTEIPKNRRNWYARFPSWRDAWRYMNLNPQFVKTDVLWYVEAESDNDVILYIDEDYE